MKNKLWKILAAAIVLALLIASCAPAATEAPAEPAEPAETAKPAEPEPAEPEAVVCPEPVEYEEPAEPKVLTVAIPQQYSDTFDIGTMVYGMEPTQMVMESLVVMDKDYNIQPGLAESWEVSDNGLTVTFNLKPCVKFHDGSDFNAEVVRWFIMDQMLAETGCCGYMYSSVEEIEVVDDLTAVFHLSSPAPAMFWFLSGLWGLVMSQEAYEADPDGFAINPVGTGPFMLEEWVQNDHLTLVKNPDYNWAPEWTGHTGPAKLDKIVYRIMPEDATRLIELEAGDVDLVLEAPWRELPTYQDNPDYQVLSSSEATIWFVGMNINEPLIADLRTRQAIGYAIDRDLIKETFYMDMGESKETYLATGMSGDKGVTALGYDPAKAAEMFTEAGWEMGDDGVLVAASVEGVDAGTKLKVSYMTYNDDEARRLAEATQKMLSDVGVKAEIQLMDKSTYDAELEAGNHQIILRRYTWDGEDILPWFHRVSYLPYPNYTGVSDPDLDVLFDDAEIQPTWDERGVMFAESHQILIDKWYPWAPIYQRPAVWIARAGVDITPFALRAGTNTEVWTLADIE